MFEATIAWLVFSFWAKLIALGIGMAIAMYLSYRVSKVLTQSLGLRREGACQ